MTDADAPPLFSKVARVTLAFWVVKICATTLGESGGDALSMSLGLGYAASSLILLACFALALAFQLAADRYRPLVYWLVVVATTTVGTTTSDYIDRTLEVGYVASSAGLALLVLAILILWRRTTGHIAVDRVIGRRDEIFYWTTILVSNTLGTALGDFTADTSGLGFAGGAALFAALIAVVAAAARWTHLSRPVLFWAAYVLTRPLGATLGDILSKPPAQGGLELDRFSASLVLALAMVALVAFTSLRKPPREETA